MAHDMPVIRVKDLLLMLLIQGKEEAMQICRHSKIPLYLVGCLALFLWAGIFEIPAQVPPIINGPGNASPSLQGVYRGEMESDRRVRRPRLHIWDRRKRNYIRVFRIIQKEAKTLSRWFENRDQESAQLIRSIIGHSVEMENKYDLWAKGMAPWTVSLEIDQFLRQLNEIAVAFEKINLIVKTMEQASIRKKDQPRNALYASTAAPVAPARESELLQTRIKALLKEVELDMQYKTNIGMVKVRAKTFLGTNEVSHYRVKCIWKVRQDIYNVLIQYNKNRPNLEGRFPGWSSPTKWTTLPPGLYTVYGIQDSGNTGPMKRFHLKRSENPDVPRIPPPEFNYDYVIPE